LWSAFAVRVDAASLLNLDNGMEDLPELSRFRQAGMMPQSNVDAAPWQHVAL
jgi:hypothetical protein